MIEEKNINKPQTPAFLVGAVMCSSFQEILHMMDRGKSIFESGYLHTLGQMQREGLIEVDLYKDGTAVVRKNYT